MPRHTEVSGGDVGLIVVGSCVGATVECFVGTCVGDSVGCAVDLVAEATAVKPAPFVDRES